MALQVNHIFLNVQLEVNKSLIAFLKFNEHYTFILFYGMPMCTRLQKIQEPMCGLDYLVG